MARKSDAGAGRDQEAWPESAVLMSAETFHELLDGRKEVVPSAELDAAVVDSIINSEIPVEI